MVVFLQTLTHFTQRCSSQNGDLGANVLVSIFWINVSWNKHRTDWSLYLSLNALGKKVLFMNKVVDFSSSHNQCLRHNEVQIEEPEKINLIDIKLNCSIHSVLLKVTPPSGFSSRPNILLIASFRTLDLSKATAYRVHLGIYPPLLSMPYCHWNESIARTP